MERSKIDLLSHVFVELTDEKQAGVLAMSKSLLQAQRYSKALIFDRACSDMAHEQEGVSNAAGLLLTANAGYPSLAIKGGSLNP